MRIGAGLTAQMSEPVIANQHMTDFIAENYVENGRRCMIARLSETAANGRSSVQPTRLQCARHERHAGKHVATRALRHLPKTIVRGKIAVLMAELRQTRAQQRKVARLLGGNFEPVAIK